MALAAMLFSSCDHIMSDGHPYPTIENMVRLTDQNMPSVESFSVEKVELPEEYANAFFYVYNDSIVIIENVAHPQPYIVTFYNMNSRKEMAGFFTKGSGPGELISATSQLHRNYLIVRDGMSHAVTRLNIDSVLNVGNAYIPFITRTKETVCSCVYSGNDTITASNPMYISSDFGVEELPEFMQYDVKTGELLAEYKENNKNFPASLTQRSIAYCNSKYIAFWTIFPIITIYDNEFNLVKMYRDDKFKDPTVVGGDSESMLISDGLNSAFCFGGQTDNYVFAINSRCQISRDEVKKNGGIQWLGSPDFRLAMAKEQEIWCFDNDMNLVRRLKCRNTIGQFSCISYNEKTNNLFITARDEDDEHFLFKCIIQ